MGKSSFLDVLSGFIKLEKNKGEVLLNKKNILNWDVKKKSEYLAYLSQSQDVLFDELVRELLKVVDPEEKLIESLGKEFNVLNLLDRNFHSLSGGEKARVSLLRVILQLKISRDQKDLKKDLSGRYLLLDEPLAHLDQIYQKDFLSCLLKLKQEGLGILIAMHDLNLAWNYADRLLIYFDGNLHECENKNIEKDKAQEGLINKIKDFYGVSLKQEVSWSF